MPINPSELISMLSNTESLINQIYWFEYDIDKPKGASHRGTAIKYVDIKEKKDEFLRELKSTMLNWVYSKGKYKEFFAKELLKRNQDLQNTSAFIQQLANQKFRKGQPQGQFGELLLFNFLQFFFRAPPLLRKMPITTNPNLERNGADAIHYGSNGDTDLFWLGEAKCYKSKYKFNEAIEDAIESIVNCFNDLENELSLYIYDDFIDPTLSEIASNFRDGKCDNARIELVCLIAYTETNTIDDENEEAIKIKIDECIRYRFSNTNDSLCTNLRRSLVSRIHYVIFPFWELDKILDEF